MSLRPVFTDRGSNTKLVSCKSSEHIQKKEDGPDCTISNNKFSSKANQNEANDYFKYRYEIRPLSFAADGIVMKFLLLFFLCVSTFIILI